MAFGITGEYVNAKGEAATFEAAYADRQATVGGFPDKSVKIIKVYAHGAPGMIGDDDVDTLSAMLGTKMAPDGQIHLLGCSTAGVDGHWWNPIGGIGLYLRMVMYHGIPKMQGDDQIAKLWAQNLARDLSRRIPNVYVLGLSGISFPLSRVLPSNVEGFEPSLLMADRFVYRNSQLTDMP